MHRNLNNSYSLLVGLYPESHGIVGNQFYDHSIHHQTKSTCQAFFNIDDERATSNMKWWQKVNIINQIFNTAIAVYVCGLKFCLRVRITKLATLMSAMVQLVYPGLIK